jgi:VWFA-related protein
MTNRSIGTTRVPSTVPAGGRLSPGRVRTRRTRGGPWRCALPGLKSLVPLALALASASVAFLPPAAMAQQVFPARVELVAVDVTVVDREGRPVADLRTEDFDVKVGGQPRKVVAAQLVRQAAPAAEAAPAAPTAAAPEPAYSSNQETPPGRLIVLVPDVGWMSTGGGRAAVDAAGRFLARLGPQDRVALITIPVGPSVDFTTDHARVAEAIQKVRGGGRAFVRGMRNLSLGEAFARVMPMGDRRVWNAAVSRECGGVGSQGFLGDCALELDTEARRISEEALATTATSVGALRRVLQALRTVEGPKTVVYVSQGLVTGRSSGNLGADTYLQPVAEDAARARASVYTILVDKSFLEATDVSVRELPETRFQDADLFRDGLEAIAGYSGGPLIKTLTTADFAFERVASETSATWLLSFAPEEDDRDGKLHEIRVAVARPGVEVRARPRFVVAPKDETPASAEAHARRSLDALLPEADVPLSLTTVCLGQAEGGAVRLGIVAEVGLERELAEPAAVGYRLLDAQGRVAAGSIEVGRLDPVRTPGGEALYYLTTVTLEPGTYGLKLAAAAPSGRTGSVERTLEVRLRPAGGALLSDLLVAEPGRRASGMALTVDGRLVGRAVRTALEIRGATTPPTVQLEVVPAGGDAPVLVGGASVRATAEPGRLSAEAFLDLASLAPGRYDLRALVLKADGTEVGRVVRPVELLPAPR